MPQRVRIEKIDELKVGEARRFDYERGGERQEGFVFRSATGLVAYRNWCPHWGVDLDIGTGKFYAKKVDRLYCRNHGALFRVHDGYCDAGPCASMSLEAFELVEEDGAAVIEVPDLPPAIYR